MLSVFSSKLHCSKLFPQILINNSPAGFPSYFCRYPQGWCCPKLATTSPSNLVWRHVALLTPFLSPTNPTNPTKWFHVVGCVEDFVYVTIAAIVTLWSFVVLWTHMWLWMWIFGKEKVESFTLTVGACPWPIACTLWCLRLAIGGRLATCCLRSKDLPTCNSSSATSWYTSATTTSRLSKRSFRRWTRTFG